MHKQFVLISICLFFSFELYSDSFNESIKPILEKNCFGCHNPKKDKGDIDLKSLPHENIDEASAEIWGLALDMINNGEMPPSKKPRLSQKDLNATTTWIENSLKKTSEELKAKEAPARLRRLNKTEYRNTIRDLIGHTFDATELFTADTSSHGFDNVGEALQVSPLHIEAYVAAAERVVSKIIDIPKNKPQKQHWKIVNATTSGNYMKEGSGAWHKGHLGKDKKKIKKGKLKGDVLPNAEIPNGSTPYSMVDLSVKPPKKYDGSWDIRAFGAAHGKGKGGGARFGFKWFAYDEGTYRVKINVECFSENDRWPHSVSIVRYPEGTVWKRLPIYRGKHTLTYEFYRDKIEWYEKTNGNRHWGLNTSYHYKKGEHNQHKVNMGMHLSSYEIEGPIYKQWPPQYHSSVFHKREKTHTDDSYAKEVLSRFMNKAFRQPVAVEQVNRMFDLFKNERKRGVSFMEAMRLPLTTVLCSPNFLYLSGPGKNQPKAYAMANRMSYFLWRTMPDETLMRMAKNKRLLNPTVKKHQLKRMLKDKRSQALVKNFTQQWLDLRKIKHLDADRKLYPGYNVTLKKSMVEESEAFFQHILDNDLPLKTFLDSDFVVVDDNMARFYGIHGVKGSHFRKVKLKPGQIRGGILGQAAVLTATSNGVRTLPVNRGVFILENILGDPPASPPPDVGQLEDVKITRPNATVREKLEMHRKDPACARCHNKIDPLGFALENYDAIGRYRKFEMHFVEGKGRQKGEAVDPAGSLPDGKQFKDLKSFKKILLTYEKKFIHCFVEKMLIYALDRHMGFRDEEYVDQLVKKLVKQETTIHSVIEAIVLSKPFSGKAL